MDGITKVLNSNKELIVDDSLSITVGSIDIPSGAGGNDPLRLYSVQIIRLKESDLYSKLSVTISAYRYP